MSTLCSTCQIYKLNIVDPHPGGGWGGWRVRCCLLSSKGGQVDTDGDDDDDGDDVYFLPKEDMCLLTNKINKVTVNFFRYKMWIRVYGCDIQDSPFQVGNG